MRMKWKNNNTLTHTHKHTNTYTQTHTHTQTQFPHNRMKSNDLDILTLRVILPSHPFKSRTLHAHKIYHTYIGISWYAYILVLYY